MQAPDTIPFRKMNGLGNDFVVLDGRPSRSGPSRRAASPTAAAASGAIR